MMGETQHVFATVDTEFSIQNKDISFEHFSKKDVSDFDSKLPNGSDSSLQSSAENGPSFATVKEKEPHSQREAVIRPQQAGKIDFKSLHNRPRFPSDGAWGAVKGSPQSPTGKSRTKEKNRRAGKGERGHQQLYRLTISSARPNPTIGIAYPQQKVTPPKKVDVGRGGHVSGSYRFHVPSIPEREVELQQEDLNFARGFSEAPSSHISSNYTSPTTAAARPNHGAKIQTAIGIPHESHGTNGQVLYSEFQGNGSNTWPSTEKSFPGANSGLSPPKTRPLPESSKLSTHCLGPLSFQYPFQPLHSSATDSFQGNPHGQDYIDVSLATSPASHGAFPFHSTSRDWKEEVLGNGSCDGAALETRAYGLAPPQFLPSPQTQGHLPCYKGRNEHSTDHNGAISPSGAIDQSPSTFQENPAVFPPSLHISSMPKPIGKRQSSSKDNVASQQILDPSSSLRRNMPQLSLPQVHFQNKAYGDSSAGGIGSGSMPFEKTLPTNLQAHPQLLQPWEGVKKTYPPMEQSSTMYLSSSGGQVSFSCHLGPEQRQQLKKTRQHLHLTSTIPGQNRIELSRKLASQKLPFPLGTTSDWDGSGKEQKSPTDYATKALQNGEGAVIPRHGLLPQHCSSANAFCFEGANDNEPPAITKSFFFGVSQGVPSPASSRVPSIPALLLPPSALAASPNESPLPSPAPNATTSTSTCSSLSPTSSSPSSHSFEEGITLNPSPFFHHHHHQCGAKDGNKPFHASEPLSSGAIHYPAADSLKALHFSAEASKDELLYKSVPPGGHFPKPSLQASKGCLDGFEAELPPPPYSSHHLLASSLSSASLDQLDVFLTCKQCDQNFSNLSSFLEHRQFCSSHVLLHQGQAKDSSRGTETKKQHHTPPESIKHPQASLGLLLPSDPHAQLFALNKTDDFLEDEEGKEDSKDDLLKASQLSGVATNTLPLSASDMDIYEAELDSLITEALNGLGYQSDNPEIDSSFIDVFADEELGSLKVANGVTPCKAKECLSLGEKTKQMDENMKTLSCYEDHLGGDTAKARISEKQKERGVGWLPDHGEESPELAHSKLIDPEKYDGEQFDGNTQLKIGRNNCSNPLLPMKQAANSVPDMKQSKNVNHASSPMSDLRAAGASVAAGNATISMKDTKKHKLRSSTWSKELIHKIVEQKNKLHKLQPKSSKVAPLPSLTDRLLQETKDNQFGEYEYISESDDERVEYAKRHCRRKLGSRFNGRLRSSFSRKRQGRGGREKEKEAGWRYGLKRERREEAKRTTSKEPGRRDDCRGRVRRRSSRSSTSSCQTTSLSSETSNSPQSTEKADSDTEKEVEQKKRLLQKSKPVGPLPRDLLTVPEKETVGRHHQLPSDLSRDSGSIESAKLQLEDFKAYQRDIPTIPPVTHMNKKEGLLQNQGKLHSSKAGLDQSSTVLFGPEDSEEHIKSTSHDNDELRALLKDGEQVAPGGNLHCHQFAAYKKETLKYHTEEFLGPSSIGMHSIPNDESASYEQVDVKCFKKQKEFVAPIGCFNDNSRGVGTPGKEGLKILVDAAETFYDCKELSDSYESSGLFSRPPATEPSQNGGIYFCQEEVDVSSFKQKHHEILPYESDHDQGKMSSPLGFDSSSVFVELPVAEFDSTLYDSVTSSKDSYVPFECASHHLGKMTPFDQQYSSFLQEKEWNLMEEVSPVLPEEMPQFHGLSVEKPLPKRYPGKLNQMPLPERTADCSVPFMSGISDDELEIKRLVNELESQLQTSKLILEEASGELSQTPKPRHSAETSEPCQQFLPLTLDQGSDEKGLFLMEEEFENASLLSAKTCSCENLRSEKTLLPSLDGKYGGHRDPWPCSVPCNPLDSAVHAPPTSELILVGPLNSKGDQDQMHEKLKVDESCGEDGFRSMRDVSSQIVPDPCLPDISMAVPSYTSSLIQNPDMLFPKPLEEPQLSLPGTLPPREDAFLDLLPKEKTFNGTAELETYRRQVSCLKLESQLEDISAQEPEGDFPSIVQSINEPEERRLSFSQTSSPEMQERPTPFQSIPKDSALPKKPQQNENQTVKMPTTDAGETSGINSSRTWPHSPKNPQKAMDASHESLRLHIENQTVCQSLAVHSKANDGEPSHFEALACPKDINREAEYEPSPQEKADNPLQQLQLFVARTVKNNEEDLLTPCFPVLPTTTHLPSSTNIQPREKEELQGSMQTEEVPHSPTLEKRTGPLVERPESIPKASDPPKLVLESGKQVEHLGKHPAALQSHERRCNVAEGEQQHLKNEHSEEDDINMWADGISLEHNNLSPGSNQVVTSLLRKERAQGGQVSGKVEEDRDKATLAFRNHQISPLSPGSFEKETSGCALTAMLAGRQPSWDEACTEDQGPSTGEVLQEERIGEQPADRLQHNLVPASPLENPLEDRCLPRGSEFYSGSGPVLAEGHGLGEKQASTCESVCLDSFSPAAGLVGQKDLQRNNTRNMTCTDFGVTPSEEKTHSPTAAKGQRIQLPAHRSSSSAEKSMQSPLEHKEQKEVLPFTVKHYGTTSPQGLQWCHAKDTEPQKSTFMHSASSLSSTDLTETKRPQELQANNSKPPSMLTFKNADLPSSEEVPKLPDQETSNTCAMRDTITDSQSASPQDILLGQSPSKVGSALPTDSRTKTNVEFILKPQCGEEDKAYSQEGKADQTQLGVKDVNIEEMSVARVTETAIIVHLIAGQIPETADNGSQNALQDIDHRGNDLEDEGYKQAENAEGSSHFVEQEKSKGRDLRETSKTGALKTKKRKGSQAICDICSVSFRSQTGLMRHKAMKHLNKKDNALLPGLVPLEKELKTSRQLCKKNRKSLIREKAFASHISKAAAGQPLPKSNRSQRREPSRETQDVVSKVFDNLDIPSLDSAFELQNTDNHAKDVPKTPSQEEREGKLAPEDRKEANTGEKEREAGMNELDGFSGKKLKGKARKGKAKVAPSQNKLTRYSQLHTETPTLCSDVVLRPVDLSLTTTTKYLEVSSTSTEEQVSQQSTSPSPPRAKESAAIDERISSAKETDGQKPLHDVVSTKEQAEDAEQDTEESCPSASTKDTEKAASNVGENQDDGLHVKEPETTENTLEEMKCRNKNSSLGCPPKLPQQSCHVGMTEKDATKVISEEALDVGDPCFVDSQSGRTEEFPPKDESQDSGGVGPDLFDDDSTFSQLFPRNDRFARRKCTRVYGKRTKKPRPIAEVSIRPEGIPDMTSIRMASDLGETSSFSVTREDPCEYDTISIDDALMLNMCYDSKAVPGDVPSRPTTQRMSLQPDVRLKEDFTDSKNGGTLSTLCQKSPTGPPPSLGSWGSLEKKGDNRPADEALLDPSTELLNGHLTVGASPEPPDLEEESYDTRANENPCSPAFHTIDMEMLNTKFEMRDVCFYRVGEDHLGCTDNECTLGFKSASVLQGRPTKNKLEEGKQGKSRSDLNFKTKDKQYKCKVCFQWFLTLGELDFHKLTHNPSPPPTCYMCVQRKFSSREQLRDHLKEKHAKNKAGLWACGMCLKEISDVWMYNEHLREHATQFARKGQAQKSVLGLPGCFGEEDAAVTQFLNSIMCRKPSKVSKHTEGQGRAPACKESKGPKETPGQEMVANRDSLEIPCKIKPPESSPKAPAVPSPDPTPKVEGAPKLVSMHPECKDPSRDCHHCGKQFPKPFKLQRHLVVHSLQKIYLCHRCPMFYQETKELRSHLSQEHGTVEEADIKHTTLYACELCADVMHVIKKSFICSTCNYTFSKKEQYDRHMEKHLVGSSKTFRFRGVMRPGVSAKEEEKKVKEEVPPKEDTPVAKKKKVGQHNSLHQPSSPGHLPCTQAPQLEGEPLLPVGPLSWHLSSKTLPPETSVKTEGLVGEFSNRLDETEKSPFDSLLPTTSLMPQDETSIPEELGHVSSLSAGQQSKGEAITESLSPSFDSSEAVSLDLTYLALKKTTAVQKMSPSHLPEKCSKELDPTEKATFAGKAESAMGTWESLHAGDPAVSKKSVGFSPASPRSTEFKRDPKTKCGISFNPTETQPQESVAKLHLPEATFHVLPLKDKPSSPTQNLLAKEIPSKKVTSGQALPENPAGIHCAPSATEEVQKPPSSKDKALADTATPSLKDKCPKEIGNKPVGSHLRSEGAGSQANPSHSDLSKCQERLSTTGLAKLHPKKRKEHKATHKGSSASRENIEGDGGKKKKARTQDPARRDGGGSGSGGRLKRADWLNSESLALSSRRGETHCNKLSPKLKVSVAGGQLKKMVLDQCFQKKAEIRHANGDLKRKKDILGSKAFPQLFAKEPSGSLPNSFQRHRAVQGAKLPDSHNYRTAESQNNLLSQLFGQKLTSFKIPLRRDTSE
ncbi:zinc finger protein 469 [Sceloporus undulatus]|uniref:zinc finger protein 469 n=1 Tax=Sceloporus undulatus TaxID=8520 RepID=UPI001C4B0FDB|nr:zinc finger protein 469 [Sceloporus undulatus]